MTDNISREVVCVRCEKRAPKDGRVLHCLHVLCEMCLEEKLEAQGGLICPADECEKQTLPDGPGESLYHVLVRSSDLYPTSPPAADTSPGNIKLCDFCEDDEACFAIHICLDCPQRPALCRQHAEKHPRQRAFREHRLSEVRSTNPEEISSDKLYSHRAGPEATCALHRTQTLSLYCKSCALLLCERCVKTGHEGSGHAVVRLEVAANETKKELGGTLSGAPPQDSTNAGAASSASCIGSKSCDQSDTFLADLIEKARANKRTVTEQAEAASRAVNEMVSRTKEAIDQEGRRLLADVDALRWTQDEELDLVINRLLSLQAKQDTASIARSKLLEDSTPPDIVVRLGTHVMQALIVVDEEMKRETLPPEKGIHFCLTNSKIREVKQMVSCMAVICDSPACDMTYVAEFQGKLCEGSTVQVTVHTIDNEGKAVMFTPWTMAFLRSPSDSTESLGTAASVTSPGSRLALTLHEAGPHKLVLKREQAVIGTVSFNVEVDTSVVTSHTTFDPQKSSQVATFSARNRIARHGSGNNMYRSLLTVHGFSSGIHTWRIRIKWHRHNPFCGVSQYPFPGSMDSFNRTSAYGWWADGDTRCGADVVEASGSFKDWKKEDVLCLTLDHNTHRLHLRVKSHDQKTYTIQNIPSMKLYPYVCLFEGCNEAEIY